MLGNSAAPISILHVVVPTDVGGMQRVVEALAVGHRRRGHRVALAGVAMAPGRAQAPWLATLRAVDVDVHVVETPGRRYGSERAAIRELCRTLHPDVVHTHGYRPDVVDAPAARRQAVPVVTTVHGFTGGNWKNRLYEYLQVRTFRRFDAVVVVSRPLAAQLEGAGVPRTRIHLVPNAWAGEAASLTRSEARLALGVPADGHIIGWVGRLSHEKGPDVLVRAIAQLDRPPATAVIVGDGPELAALRAAATQLGVADRIVWPGAVPGAGRLMRAFDVFVLSSRTEGTPIVLFEAMASDVPVVTTDVGGIPDVVGDTEAVLVPSDAPQALASAIRGILSNRVLASERASAARRRLETRFAPGPWLDRYEAIYRGVLGAAG